MVAPHLPVHMFVAMIGTGSLGAFSGPRFLALILAFSRTTNTVDAPAPPRPCSRACVRGYQQVAHRAPAIISKPLDAALLVPASGA